MEVSAVALQLVDGLVLLERTEASLLHLDLSSR